MTLPARICDPHHHLWLRPGLEYLPADLERDIATVPEVVRTVFVECGAWYRTSGEEWLRAVGETEWVAEHGGSRVAAIVGTGDLRLGDRVAELLEAHVGAGRGRFRGIRQRATWDADAGIAPSLPYSGRGLLLDPWFRRGMTVLTSMGLHFEVWMYFAQLPDLVDLARSHPDASFVLDHLGGPITLGPYADRASTLAAWRPLMAEVATCPNVTLKIGGIGMPMFHDRPLRDQVKSGVLLDVDQVLGAWAEPIRYCLELFGPDRCMFESNFPVDRTTMSYTTVWATFDAVSADLSPAERQAVFHDTAVRVYRLPHPNDEEP